MNPLETATFGECPVCGAREGMFCNPEQGMSGTHYGRVRKAQEAVANRQTLHTYPVVTQRFAIMNRNSNRYYRAQYEEIREKVIAALQSSPQTERDDVT